MRTAQDSKHSSGTTLYCFSPPVMLATFGIETVLLIYTLVRYRMTTINRLVVAIVACLAVFQFAEYNVCGTGANGAYWSRIGYIAITLLPALGLHLIGEIANRSSMIITGAGYAASMFFIALFAFDPVTFSGSVCGGNYAIFQLTSPRGGLFFIYYYVLLFIGICLAYYYKQGAAAGIRKGLTLQIAGYMSFMVPTGVVNSINPQTMLGIPSIMCGFAVIYALVLVLGIVPLTADRVEERAVRVKTNR